MNATTITTTTSQNIETISNNDKFVLAEPTANLLQFDNQELVNTVCKTSKDAVKNLAEFDLKELGNYQKFLQTEQALLKFINGVPIPEKTYNGFKNDKRLNNVLDKDILIETVPAPTAKEPDKVRVMAAWVKGYLNQRISLYRAIDALYDGENKPDILHAVGKYEKAVSRMVKAEKAFNEIDENHPNYMEIAKEFSSATKNLQNRQAAFNNVMTDEIKALYNSAIEQTEGQAKATYNNQLVILNQYINVLKIAISDYKRIQAEQELVRIEKNKESVKNLHRLLMNPQDRVI